MTMKKPDPLIRQVFAEHPTPTDAFEVAAMLESLGITDKLAKQRFGEEDVFTLAERLYHEWTSQRPVRRRQYTRQQTPQLAEYLSTFGQSLVFMAPLAATLFSATTFHFGLWTWTAAYSSEQMTILLAP
jgi:hypothetical protein